MSRSSLRSIFAPRSVAIIGASQDPRKRGHQAIRALLAAGYQGRVSGVNPRGGEVLGIPLVRSVEALDSTPELAFICTPAATVPRLLSECAARGVRAAIVAGGGFREAGAGGEALERELVVIARRTGLRVLGPNTSGIVNPALGLNLAGVPNVRPGAIALVSQSGNVGLDVMTEASDRGIGISLYIGLGNQADVSAEEVMEYLARDRGTGAVLVYVEGFREGRRFVEVAGKAARRKPVVVLKGGRSVSGASSARSHTGAVAGPYAVLAALLGQRGVIVVRRSDELLPVGEMLARQPPVQPGAGVVVLADGGGHATLAVDALVELGVPLARLSVRTCHRLRRLLGPAAGITNPIDLAGAADRDPSIFPRTLRILATDPALGGILITGLFGGYAARFETTLAGAEAEAASAMTATMATMAKPLVVHTLYARTRSEALERLAGGGVPVNASLEIAVRCLSAAVRRGHDLARRRGATRSRPRRLRAAGRALESARSEGRDVLTEIEARALVAAFGVPLVRARLCRTPAAAAATAKAAGKPMALKVVSPGITHKTEAGGVALDVSGPDAAATAFRRIVDGATAHAERRGIPPDVRGVLVTPMLPAPAAELLVGARRDPLYGPLLVLGAGGIAVELLGHIAIRGLPIDRAEAFAMIEELRLAPLLDGFRGRPPSDREAIADLLLAVAACTLAYPDISSVEINPAFIYPQGVVAVDVRAFLCNTANRLTASSEAARAVAHPGGEP